MKYLKDIKNSYNCSKCLYIFAILLFLLLNFLLLKFLDRGFDFSDEGFYYLTFKFPYDVLETISTYYYLSAYIFELLKCNIVFIRIFALVVFLLTTFLFAYTFFKMNNNFKIIKINFIEEKLAIMSVLFIFMALNYAISPVSLSYNFWNVILLTNVLSLFMYIYSLQNENKRLILSVGLYLMCAILIGLDFFVKISSSIIMLIFLVLHIIINKNIRVKLKFVVFSSVFLGFCLVFGYYFNFVQSWEQWQEGNKLALVLFAHSDGSLFIWILRYVRELTTICLQIIVLNKWLIVFFVLSIFYLWKSKKKNFGELFLISWLIFFISSISQEAYKASVWIAFRGEVFRFYFTVLLLLCSQYIVLLLSKGVLKDSVNIKNNIQLCLMVVVFLLFPFFIAVGTVNPIALNVVMGLVTWNMLIVILIYRICEYFKNEIYKSVGLMLIALVAFSQVICGFIYMPYGNLFYDNGYAMNLKKQNVLTEIGFPETKIFLDFENHIFINSIKKILKENDFENGDDILALFDMPGLVYAVGGRSPGRPWYFGSLKTMEQNEYFLKLVEKKRIMNSFVFTKNDIEEANTLLYKVFRLQLTKNYKEIGNVKMPYINDWLRIWKIEQ